MLNKPSVAVLPVAGLSTRNLPATKAMHKGFLCLNNLPIIQYAVDACVEAGVEEIIFVYSPQLPRSHSRGCRPQPLFWHRSARPCHR